MTGGEGYAKRHLQQSDYYDQNRTVQGQWHGRGAELLGLKGEVTSEDFEAVRQGLDPQTGEFLRLEIRFIVSPNLPARRPTRRLLLSNLRAQPNRSGLVSHTTSPYALRLLLEFLPVPGNDLRPFAG